MHRRHLTPDFSVSALGLGCMGMSEFYGPRDDTQSLAVLDRAADLGVTFFDTADTYGPHHNEELLGQFLRTRKPQAEIATKFGIVRNPGEYRREIDNSPAYVRRACEASLKRLGVERIFTVDPRGRGRRAAHLRRTGHRFCALFTAGARVPDRGL